MEWIWRIIGYSFYGGVFLTIFIVLYAFIEAIIRAFTGKSNGNGFSPYDYWK
jgi:hypothetical protein